MSHKWAESELNWAIWNISIWFHSGSMEYWFICQSIDWTKCVDGVLCAYTRSYVYNAFLSRWEIHDWHKGFVAIDSMGKSYVMWKDASKQ